MSFNVFHVTYYTTLYVKNIYSIIIIKKDFIISHVPISMQSVFFFQLYNIHIIIRCVCTFFGISIISILFFSLCDCCITYVILLHHKMRIVLALFFFVFGRGVGIQSNFYIKLYYVEFCGIWPRLLFLFLGIEICFSEIYSKLWLLVCIYIYTFYRDYLRNL